MAPHVSVAYACAESDMVENLTTWDSCPGLWLGCPGMTLNRLEMILVHPELNSGHPTVIHHYHMIAGC